MYTPVCVHVVSIGIKNTGQLLYTSGCQVQVCVRVLLLALSDSYTFVVLRFLFRCPLPSHTHTHTTDSHTHDKRAAVWYVCVYPTPWNCFKPRPFVFAHKKVFSSLNERLSSIHSSTFSLSFPSLIFLLLERVHVWRQTSRLPTATVPNTRKHSLAHSFIHTRRKFVDCFAADVFHCHPTHTHVQL